MSVPDQISDVLANLPEEFKNIDILVNNAGLALGISATHENKLVKKINFPPKFHCEAATNQRTGRHRYRAQH